MGANSLIKYDPDAVSFPKLSGNADRQQLCTAKDARIAIPLSHSKPTVHVPNSSIPRGNRDGSANSCTQVKLKSILHKSKEGMGLPTKRQTDQK